jgi:hypothetical protein
MGLEGLQFVQVDMPLVAGVDTRDDPRALPLGKLTTLENCEINRVGRIEPRHGIVLGAAAAPGPSAGGRPDTTLVSVAARGDELIAVGDRRVSAWSPAYDAWVDRGRAPGPAVTTSTVQADARTSLTLQDSASTPTYTVVASVEASSDATNARRLRVTVIDIASGGDVANWIYSWGTGDNDVPLEQYPVVVAGVGYVWVFLPQMVGTGHTTLKVNYIVVDTGTLDTKPTMSAYTATGQVEGRVVFDACYWPNEDAAIALVPTTLSPGNDTAVVKVNNTSSLTVVSYTQLSATSSTLKAVGICVDVLNPGYHFVVANDGNQTSQRRLLNGVASGAGVALTTGGLLNWEFHRIGVVATGVSSAAYGAEFVAVLDQGSVTGALAVRVCTTSTSGTFTAKLAPQLVSLMSRPFVFNQNVYYVVSEARGWSYFLLDANYTPLGQTPDPNATQLASTILPKEGGGVQGAVILWQGAITSYTNVQHLTSVTEAGGAYRLAVPRALESQWLLQNARTGTETYQDRLRQSRTVTALTDLVFQPAVANVVTGPTTHLAGGAPTDVDAARAYEMGFAWEPWNLTASAGAGGTGAKLEAGTYSYAVCYAHTRADGSVERSAPVLLKTPVVTSSLLATTTEDFQQPDVYEATKSTAHGAFTVPGIGLSTNPNNVSVGTTSWMTPGQVVFSTTGGFYKIDGPSAGPPPHTWLVNPYRSGPSSPWFASALNASVGSTVPSGVLYANLSAFKVDSTAKFYTGQQIKVNGPTTTDKYVVHQVWDANWVIVRSVSGNPTAVGDVIGHGAQIFAVAETIDLSWNALTLTNKTSVSSPSPDLVAEVYRTADLGSVYYFVTALQMTTGTVTMTYTDNVPQAVVESNRMLYTGSTIEHFMPPSATHITEHGGRLMLSGCEDPTRIVASLYLTPFEAPAFSPESLYIQCPEPIVATASLDSALVAFARSAIYVIFGDGPDDLGLNDNWSLPNKLPSDVGCIEPRSVVVIPDGVLFQSARGIFLLTRKRELQFVGSDVQGILAQYPVITSAVLLQDKKHVRFTLVPQPGSDQGVVLTYFYEYGQWGTATHRNTFGDPLCAAGASLVNGTYWTGSYTRDLYVESSGYADADGSVIVSSFGGEASFDGQWGHVRLQKVRLLGRALSLAAVQLVITTDEDLSRRETVAWSSVDAPTLEHVLAYQIGSRYQYVVTVTPATAVGDTQVNSLQFFSGRRRGMARVPATSRS